LALDGGEWSASGLGRFIPGEGDPGTRWLGGRVCHRAGLDAVGNKKNPFSSLWDSNTGRPVCSLVTIMTVGT